MLQLLTISHLLNFDAATVQGRPLIEGGIYCTEAPSVYSVVTIQYSWIKRKVSEVSHACYCV